MGKGSGNGTTRGDRKRNARRERLRGLLPRGLQEPGSVGVEAAQPAQRKSDLAACWRGHRQVIIRSL